MALVRWPLDLAVGVVTTTPFAALLFHSQPNATKTAVAIAALLPWTTYLFGSHFRGRPTGVAAAVFVAFLPRVLSQPTLGVSALALATAHVAASYTYWKALSQQDRRRVWWMVMGLSYGVALLLGSPPWLLPLALFAHWIWLRLARRAENNSHTWVPYGLLVMLVVGAALFALGSQIKGAAPALNRANEPSAPAPWLLLSTNVPVVTLCFMLLGFARASRSLTPEFVERLIPALGRLPGYRDTHRTAALWFLSLVTPPLGLTFAKEPAPVSIAAVPFIALFAALAVHEIAKRLRERTER